MRNLILIAISSILVNTGNAAVPLADLVRSFELENISCESYPNCEPQAEICGFLAGIEIGAKVCNGASEPNPDWVWAVKELRAEHCMGALPIIAAQSNESLKNAFKTSYFKGLQAYKSSCKKSE